MWEIEISEKAKKICKEHYTYECDDNCPLRSPCKDNFILSEENINENIRRINELAEKVNMSCKDCIHYEDGRNGERGYCHILNAYMGVNDNCEDLEER